MTAGASPRPVGSAFLIGYAVAYIGAFIGVAPLLQVLAPLHAGLIDGEAKGPLLSQALFWGCMAAGGGNIIGGALSDRTRSRHGRRRPWIVVGAALTVCSYAFIQRSSTPLGLIGGLICFQLAFNVLLAPLIALFADRVPENRRSAMSAIMGMGYPVAAMIGSVVMAWGPQGEVARFATLAVVVLAATVPFALLSREDPVPPDQVRAPLSGFSLPSLLRPFATPDFSLAWTYRFLVVTGYSLVAFYLLFYIADAIGFSNRFPGRSAEAGHSILTAIAVVGVVGVSSIVAMGGSRITRRKPLAVAGGVLLAVAATTLATTQDWTTVVVAFAVYGVGQGCYGAIDIALMTDVLPSEVDRGKDLGLINLAVTLPQAIAPLIALVLLESLGLDFRSLFLAAAVCFGGATLAVSAIRRVR
ncbi:MFS transporter [Brevundimonas sp.]|jgi:MFS family permease|uniref:MFS transporter n=1 Tax=Brevundimonas sp. TaxID=1871086 RepID=UPI00181AD57D|nr:MFS transporter [Brevundimonas sp.]MBA4806630.1 MFS transporter [Brevundimonas sp.]